MAVQVSYPGVYIEEFAPGAPIEGVGTSTAAFLGPWKYGVPNDPKKIFSWDDFKREFGNPSGSSEPPADDDYLWYAVRGFFENGGRICYVARVSNAEADSASLDDDAANTSRGITPAPVAQPTIMLRARIAKDYRPNPIKVAITHSSAAHSQLVNPTTTLGSRANQGDMALEVASAVDAMKFRPGDLLAIGTGAEMPSVAGINGKLIRLTAPLGGTYQATQKRALGRSRCRDNDRAPRRRSYNYQLATGSVIKLAERRHGSGTVYATVKESCPKYRRVKDVASDIANQARARFASFKNRESGIPRVRPQHQRTDS